MRKKIGYVLAATQALCEGDTATPIQERGGPGQKKVLRSLEELRQNMLEREMREAKMVEQNKLAIPSLPSRTISRLRSRSSRATPNASATAWTTRIISS